MNNILHSINGTESETNMVRWFENLTPEQEYRLGLYIICPLLVLGTLLGLALGYY